MARPCAYCGQAVQDTRRRYCEDGCYNKARSERECEGRRGIYMPLSPEEEAKAVRRCVDALLDGVSDEDLFGRFGRRIHAKAQRMIPHRKSLRQLAVGLPA